jgi:hypothetical protein
MLIYRFIAAAALVLLAACTPNDTLMPQDWVLAVQTAESREAHEALARHYEEVALNLQKQAEEERQMLAKYLATPYKYGKRFQDLKADASAEVADLERAVQESRRLAEYHWQMAQEAE